MSPSKNKGVKKKKKGVSKSTQAKKNRMGKKVEKITQQLQEVQNEGKLAIQFPHFPCTALQHSSF